MSIRLGGRTFEGSLYRILHDQEFAGKVLSLVSKARGVNVVIVRDLLMEDKDRTWGSSDFVSMLSSEWVSVLKGCFAKQGVMVHRFYWSWRWAVFPINLSQAGRDLCYRLGVMVLVGMMVLWGYTHQWVSAYQAMSRQNDAHFQHLLYRVAPVLSAQSKMKENAQVGVDFFMAMKEWPLLWQSFYYDGSNYSGNLYLKSDMKPGFQVILDDLNLNAVINHLGNVTKSGARFDKLSIQFLMN